MRKGEGEDMARKSYRVDYEQNEDGYWTAVIDRSQGASCVTQGRSLSVARRRIREALALDLDDEVAAAQAELVENFELPAAVKAVVAESTGAREQARLAAEQAQAASAKAAKRLAKAGVSLRDAAEILGISFQRVHQLVERKAG